MALTMNDIGGLVQGGQINPAGTIASLLGTISETQDVTSALNLSAAGSRTQADIIGRLQQPEQERQFKRIARRFQGKEAVRTAKSGLSFGGSAAQVFADNAQEIAREFSKIQYNALVQQNALRFSALKKETAARNAKAQMWMDLSKTLLTDVAGPIAKADASKTSATRKQNTDALVNIASIMGSK